MAFNPVRDLIIPFNRGLNQQVSTLELGPSELFSVLNYEMAGGLYSGLRSISGYERYDGTALASETPVIWTDEEETESDDTARLAARDAILEVPGSGPVLAVFSYNGAEYAIRWNTDKHKMYEATGAGWSEHTGFSTLNISTASTERYDVKTGRFSFYPAVVPNEEVLILCNGVSDAVILSIDVGANTVAEYIAGGDLPTTEFPTISLSHSNKLLLAYPNGHLFVSGVGSPLYWSAVDDLAFEIFFGDEITNLVSAPNSIFITMENMIKVMTSPDGIDVIVNTFSDTSGAIKGTAVNFLGTIFYCSDVGIVTAETTEALGDFKAAVISENIQRTYLQKVDEIVGAVIDKQKDQYIVYYNDQSGIICTYNKERKLKGATLFRYATDISSFYRRDFFGSSNGFVYKIHDLATSFDCEKIVSSTSSSYYSYKAVSNYKRFLKVLFEVTAEKGTELKVRPDYEYNTSSTVKAVIENLVTSVSSNPGIWSLDNWSTFVWSGAAVSVREVYIRGIGRNMSINVASSNIYKQPHIVHNVVVSYQIMNRRL